MKKFKDISEFENLLKGEFTNHSVPPPPDVWSAVSSGVAGNSVSVISQVTSYFTSVTNILKVALFAGGISAAGLTLYNSNTTTSAPLNTETQNEQNILIDSIADEEDFTKTDGSNNQETTTLQKGRTLNSNTKNTSDKLDASNLQGYNSQLDNASMQNLALVPQTSKPIASTDNNKSPDQSITLALFASNNNPCVGQTVSITNTRKEKGTWLENGKVIAENSANLSYKCSNQGIVNISFKTGERVVNTILKVQATHAEIMVNSDLDQNYSFKLSNSALLANWYLDGKKLADNTTDFNRRIDNFGKHTIKAEVLNAACDASISKDFSVKAKGKIEFYNIFTPNGDGKNDNYVVNIEHYDFFLIKIYDGSNNLVFESQNPDLQWNGNYQTSGLGCPNGEYIARLSYKLQGEDAKQKNIKITLIRD